MHEAELAYEEGIRAFREAGDETAAAIAMRNLGRALWRHGHVLRGPATCRLEAIAILERDPGPELVSAYEGAASAETLGGRSEEGIAWAEKAIALASSAGNRERRSRPADARPGTHRPR